MNEANYADDQLIEILSKLAMIEATGSTNGQPRLGISGAEEAFNLIVDFFTEDEPT